MMEITQLNNERMRAALELLEAKIKRARVSAGGEIAEISEIDVDEVLLVAGMKNKELEVI